MYIAHNTQNNKQTALINITRQCKLPYAAFFSFLAKSLLSKIANLYSKEKLLVYKDYSKYSKMVEGCVTSLSPARHVSFDIGFSSNIRINPCNTSSPCFTAHPNHCDQTRCNCLLIRQILCFSSRRI